MGVSPMFACRRRVPIPRAGRPCHVEPPGVVVPTRSVLRAYGATLPCSGQKRGTSHIAIAKSTNTSRPPTFTKSRKR